MPSIKSIDVNGQSYSLDALPEVAKYGIYMDEEEPYSEGSTTEFLANGSIKTTFTGGMYVVTSFPANGSIVKTLYDSSNVVIKTSTTTFLANGSIQKVVT